MKNQTLLPLVIAALAVGCNSVPTSEIVFGNTRAKLPKDSSADSLEVAVQNSQGSFTFKATNWSTKNNPAVIGASTDQIRAHYQGAEGLVKTAVEASRNSGGVDVLPAP